MNDGRTINVGQVLVQAPQPGTTGGSHAIAPYVCAHRDGTWYHTNGPCPGDACVFKPGSR